MFHMVIAIDIRLLGKKRTGDEAVFFHLTKELLHIPQTEAKFILLTDETEATKIASLSVRLECVGQTNVDIVTLPARNRFSWNFFVLPRYLFQHKVDIFHTQYILPFFFPQRTKIVTHIHDVSFCAYPELIGFFDRFFLSVLIPRSLRKAAMIITPSQFTKDEIIKYYALPEKKIVIISNSIGEEFFSKEEQNAERTAALRKKYGLPEQFILSVGTLQPRKNIPFLLSAYALLRKRLPEMKLVIVGKRNAHHTDARIETTLTTEGLEKDVVFPGFIDQNDLPLIIGLAKVFAFPSLYEGFGIPLLEAMSQNVPVAASDIPSLREIGGKAALYFDPTHIAHFEEILYTLCTQQEVREGLILEGKERVQCFSWKESALSLFFFFLKLFHK